MKIVQNGGVQLLEEGANHCLLKRQNYPLPQRAVNHHQNLITCPFLRSLSQPGGHGYNSEVPALTAPRTKFTFSVPVGSKIAKLEPTKVTSTGPASRPQTNSEQIRSTLSISLAYSSQSPVGEPQNHFHPEGMRSPKPGDWTAIHRCNKGREILTFLCPYHHTIGPKSSSNSCSINSLLITSRSVLGSLLQLQFLTSSLYQGEERPLRMMHYLSINHSITGYQP